MSTTTLREIMTTAWSYVKAFGYTMSEALKVAWANKKVLAALRTNPVVRFSFKKVDGSIRMAYGTLVADRIPDTAGTGYRPSPKVQVYYDIEKGEWRCFRKELLIGLV